MLDRLLRQQLLNRLSRLEELERRLDQAVEQESKVHQQGEADHLQPLERLPSKAERHDPNEQRTAGVNGRPRCRADGPGDGQAKEVETARARLVNGTLNATSGKE